MNVSIVWIDGERAKLFHVSDDRMERDELKGSRQSPAFLEAIASKLGQSRQILLLSPNGEGKEFGDALALHSPKVGRRIVACEVLALPDDWAIAEFALQYFRKPIRSQVS